MKNGVDDRGGPDVIVIEVEREREVFADRADVRVAVTGSSLFTGRAALTQAREVGQLVSALVSVGVGPECVTLQGVHANVTGGLFSRSSSATYLLKVRCAPVERLADVLGVIGAAKSVALGAITWLYDEQGRGRGAWLAECLAEANERARAAAAALGVPLLGVHRMTESLGHDEHPAYAPQAAFGETMMRSRSTVTEAINTEVSHAKRLTLRVVVEYKAGPFAAGAVPP